MNFEPQKFFIGLMDLFSILMPGALLVWLMQADLVPAVLGDRLAGLGETGGWAAFLFASYLFGHLVFLLGSWLDEVYDALRRRTLNAQIAALALQGRRTPALLRAVVWLVFRRERNLALHQAARIKAAALGPMGAEGAINTFQWCKALLTLESPDAQALVLRFEADSKFFRCLAIVLLLVMLAWPWQGQWPAAGVLVVAALGVLALWRYMELRLKATNQAYWGVITLAARNPGLLGALRAPEPGPVSHAGGVVRRQVGGRAEYLLVEARRTPGEWVLPKGHVEPGETLQETAVREVLEETGHWARIRGDLGVVRWATPGGAAPGGAVTVHLFLMQPVGRGHRLDKDRRTDWLPLEAALARASHEETRVLLRAADAMGLGESGLRGAG